MSKAHCAQACHKVCSVHRKGGRYSLLVQYNITKRASAVVLATTVDNTSTLSSTHPTKVIKTTASQCYPEPNSNRIQFVDISGPPVSSNAPASSCLDAGSKPDHLRNLCHCRSRQRRDQEASWRLMGMRQPRRPELGQRRIVIHRAFASAAWHCRVS